MRIIQEVKIDFDDVLICPKRSEIGSRANVELTRTYKMLNSKTSLTGIGVFASNMDTTGTFAMCEELAKSEMYTCLHKFYSVEKLIDFFNNNPAASHAFYTLGVIEQDINKLISVSGHCHINKICIDVANGYSKFFVEKVRYIRELFPSAIIMAGNIATPEMVQELLIEGKADIIKVGIGPGCFIAGTRVLTENGKIPIEKIKVGNKVYTHTGTIQKVIQTLSRIEKNA